MISRAVGIILGCVVASSVYGAGPAVDSAVVSRLIKEIRADTTLTRGYTGRSVLDARVMAVMQKVPRHEFVDSGSPDVAWQNVPLSIGHGQTISQPFIVALMTDLIDPDSDMRVLEIGTGSGYQAAVLGELVEEVFTIEIIEPLARTAEQRLARLGYDNVTVRHGDGFYGWPEKAPFDAIVVTAVAEEIPAPLLAQLKRGGKMILPVGEVHGGQNLVLVTKDANGEVASRNVLPVMFVPLTGNH
ncbi:MAG: protein-L-isoaspartate(D-aspartate) O-methyltransferase [Gammaproteobacteria bacterium]|nr:protein-L-isoaspartate(D-aspartate) O-methyltransferase [Gammaproteobacteria bacterium]